MTQTACLIDITRNPGLNRVEAGSKASRPLDNSKQ